MLKNVRHKVALGVALMLVLGCGLGWWWQGAVRHQKYQDLLTAFYVMGVVKINYYQPVNLENLIKAYWAKGNISGMLKSLNDPYTRFLNRTEYAELKKDTSGSFAGIGIFFIVKEGELLISKVVAGSPSQTAGLQEGDRIIAIQKVPVKNMSTDVAVAKIRGKIGTSVTLLVARGSGEERRQLTFEVKRENIVVPTVELNIKSDRFMGSYALIKIIQFADTTAPDLERALRKIDAMVDCRALILDLRANPGGSLEAAIKVASEFIPADTPVLHVKRRNLPWQVLSAEYFAHRRLPMVVLVNSWSASASEIVSGALKDQKRATLVGTHTFGKDLIQEVKELPGGTAMTVTIASYLTSGKVNIHKRGVQPDRVVEIPGALDRLLKNGDPGPFKRMNEMQEAEALKILREQVLLSYGKMAS
ncbi:MAG TPA: peptidase S41 [Firmicutes bacterium]|nr:peptidase S41 [Bacillota bacterium]